LPAPEFELKLMNRAINFYFYPTSKVYLAKQFPNAPTEKEGQTSLDSPVIHLSAAVIAGIMTATGTNPIWGMSTPCHCYNVMLII
jgi:solute carrier family 25 protein 33/36